MMLRPGVVDLEMWAGATWEYNLTWYADDAGTIPVDLTGFHAILTVGTFDGRGLLMCVDGDGITLGGALGTIELGLPDTATFLEPGIHNWQLEMADPDGSAYRLLEGRFQVHGEVSA